MKNHLNILAFSDNHGVFPKIPTNILESEIDVLIMCGDICGHFKKNWSHNDYFQRMVNVPAEGKDQKDWFVNTLRPWIDKTIKPKHTVFVQGNHDFADLSDIGGMHYVFTGSKVVEIEGVKLGLLGGSMTLAGEWHDEVDEYEMNGRILNLDSDIDILVSHVPIFGVMDQAFNGDRIGCKSLREAVFGLSSAFSPEDIIKHARFENLQHSFWGHCHEKRGDETHEIEGRQVHFHNVAERYVAVEFKKEV